MGIFKSLFGKNDSKPSPKSPTITVQISEQPTKKPSLHLRGKKDCNGLYPAELVMLSVAENFKTTSTEFAGYLTYTYEIANPAKMLKDLSSRGFLAVASPKYSLPKYKVAELKEFATAVGITPKGKKADIIAQLEAVDDSILDPLIKDRYWALTDAGRKAINDNPYIQYFLSGHKYSVSEVGVDIWSVNEEFVINPKRPYRDIIFHQISKKMNDASIDFQRNPGSGDASTHTYCWCLRLMGLFMEEEGRSYSGAADYYFQYLFSWINLHRGFALLKAYKLFKNDREYQKNLIPQFYEDIKLYPGQREELFCFIDELNISDGEVRDTLITSFKRAQFGGIMTPEETADFVILELSGDVEQSEKMATTLAKKAVKKIK